METLEEYLDTLKDERHRQRLLEITTWIAAEFPQLGFKIAWKQPMYIDHGTFILGFSVSKNHISVSPEKQAIDIFSERIKEAGYTHSSNLFRILWNDDIPYSLLKKIIQYNLDDKKEYTTFWRV